MKLLHVFDLFSPPLGGGTVAIIHKIARALARKGHEIVVYTSDFQLDQQYIDSLEGIKVHAFRCISHVGNFFLTPAIITEAKKQIQNFDVVHLHCFRSFQNIIIHHYAKKYRIPYVLDAHGSVPRTTRSQRNTKWLLKWLYDIPYGYSILRDAARVIAETEKGYDEYIEMGVARDKIDVITPPFDVEEFADLPASGLFREKYHITAKHIILFLGRIHWIKGLDFLVESFGEMVKSGTDAILVIAGPDDGFQADLEKLIAELNITEKVLFTGYIDGEEKLASFVDADVVVQTSVYEQGTGVPFEAILCGTPIIVSSNTVASENVKSIDAGYLVEYGNKNELIATIHHVLKHRDEAKAKTKKAGKYVRANLSLEKGVEKYEQVYMEVTGTT